MTYQHAVQTLLRMQHICIASHISPDADAIGSMVALGQGLLQRGKKVTMFSHDGVPQGLRFLAGTEHITKSLDTAHPLEGLVLVDCATPKRAGEAIETLARRLPPYLIDHHILPDVDQSAHCIDEKAAATGEVVYRILCAMGCTVTPDIATAVYSTLVGDTGHYRYSNTTPAVFRLAAELVEHGADPWFVSSNLLEQIHPATYSLLQQSLATLQIGMGGRYAHMVLTQEMLKEADALPEYAEEFVSYPRSLAGVEVAAFYRELPDRRWKVSLRSKRYVDVAAITACLGGGGHHHAAGCTLELDLATTRQTIEKAVEEALGSRPAIRVDMAKRPVLSG